MPQSQSKGNYSGQSQRMQSNPLVQSKFEAITRSAGKLSRASHDWFGFTSDWLRKWREFFKPITERSNAKPKLMQITFDTQVKTALIENCSIEGFNGNVMQC